MTISSRILFLIILASPTINRKTSPPRDSEDCYYSDCVRCDFKDRTKCKLCEPSHWLLYGMCLKCTENCEICKSLKTCRTCNFLYFKSDDEKCYGVGLIGTCAIGILGFLLLVICCAALLGILKGKRVDEGIDGPNAPLLSYKSRSTYLSRSNLPEIKEEKEEVEESPNSNNKTIDLFDEISPRKMAQVFVLRV